jgi:hypothetical protein
MSTNARQPVQVRGSDAFYRLAALGTWALSCYTTFVFLHTLNHGATWSLGLALVLQAAMTGLESPIWRGRGGPVHYIVLAVDTFINVGGLAPLAANVDQTPSYDALAAVVGLGALPGGAELLLAAGMGILLAAGPEALWNAGKG